MAEITEERLRKWEKLCEEATAGPWRANGLELKRDVDEDALTRYYGDNLLLTSSHIGAQGFVRKRADAAFIAESRTAMVALIAGVRRLRGEVEHG